MSVQHSEGRNIPVLFLVFNRPDTTTQVWNVLRQIRPRKLYIAADGPRPHKNNEAEKVAQVRKITQPDWECEVTYWFQETNLGCRNHVSQAITKFFEYEECGIILEDDCLPVLSFFPFCERLLIHYKDDTRIMHISGDNFQHGVQRGNASYYFSRFNHIWGWATWRRAWKLYNVNMPDFPEFCHQNSLKNIFSNPMIRLPWYQNFYDVYSGKDTWDFQWTYTIWKNNGLAILPQNNLITNIGFGAEATHTHIKVDSISELQRQEVDMEKLTHPTWVMPNIDADDYTFNQAFKRGLITRLKFRLKLLLGNEIPAF